MLCSKLHCQEGFNLYNLSFDIKLSTNNGSVEGKADRCVDRIHHLHTRESTILSRNTYHVQGNLRHSTI